MTLWIVLGSVVAYFVVGAVYARSQVVHFHEIARRTYPTSAQYVREEVREALTVTTCFWPVALFATYVFFPLSDRLGSWFMRPVKARQDRAQQLRADAEAWRAKQYDGTEAERKMAAELARLCDQMAREADL